MGKHRSKLIIIADILSVVKNGALKTTIMYQANLSYALLQRYLNKLVTVGLISKKKNNYILSIEGQKYLDKCLDYIISCEELEKRIIEAKNIETELINIVY